MVQDQQDFQMKKKKITILPSHYTPNSRETEDLNVKGKIIKLLKDNTEEHLWPSN